MAEIIGVAIVVAIVGGLIWLVYSYWAIIVAFLAAISALLIGIGIAWCVHALFVFVENSDRDLEDYDVKDFFVSAPVVLGTLFVELCTGFLSWAWLFYAVASAILMFFLLWKSTWRVLGSCLYGIWKIVLLFWEGLSWIIGKVKLSRKRRAATIEAERRRAEEAERQARMEEERRKEAERRRAEEAKRQARMEEERRKEEELRKEEEAIRRDKESRALSELDELRLKKLAKERLLCVNGLMEKYKRRERAEIIGCDPSAFNDYDVPYSQIDLTFRAFGTHIPVSVVFSLEHIVKAVIGDTEVMLSEWIDFESRLEDCLTLAQTEFQVFPDVDFEAQNMRYKNEDSVLSCRVSQSVEGITGKDLRKLDIFDELKLKELAFCRMQDINGIFEEFYVPARADYSSVTVDTYYDNPRGLPHAVICIEIKLDDKPVKVLIAFDCNNVIECRVGKDVKKVDSWDEVRKVLYPYFEPMVEEWREVARARAVAHDQEELKQKEEEHNRILAEQAQAEASLAAEKSRLEKMAKTLDDKAELELRSIAHQRRNEINQLLGDFDRAEHIGEEAVIVDSKAFNEFEQPYACFNFRLKLIGKLYDYDICLNKDCLLRFSCNSKPLQDAVEWDDVINELEEMLDWAKNAGIDVSDDESAHTGCCRIGFLHNFDTHLHELANLAGKRVDVSALDIKIRNQQKEGSVYYDEEMRQCQKDMAKFQVYDTGLRDKESSRAIYAKFWKGENNWFGVQFLTMRPQTRRTAENRTNEKLMVWKGADNIDEHRQEQNDVAIIIKQISTAIENGMIDWCHVLYNFRIRVPNANIPHRQIDLALIVKNQIILLELKHYSNPVRGTEKDVWKTVDSSTGKEISISAGNYKVANPFQQVKITREYMGQFLASSNLMKDLNEETRRKIISAVVIFSDDLRKGLHDEIGIDTSSLHKWFYYGRISETIEILRRVVVSGEDVIETSDKAAKIIKDVLGLQEADLAQGVPVAKKLGVISN